jgi:hypothetical protein
VYKQIETDAGLKIGKRGQKHSWLGGHFWGEHSHWTVVPSKRKTTVVKITFYLRSRALHGILRELSFWHGFTVDKWQQNCCAAKQEMIHCVQEWRQNPTILLHLSL